MPAFETIYKTHPTSVLYGGSRFRVTSNGDIAHIQVTKNSHSYKTVRKVALHEWLDFVESRNLGPWSRNDASALAYFANPQPEEEAGHDE